MGRRRRRRRHLENVQISGNAHFSQNCNVLKFQKLLFSRNKSPCGSFPPEVTFSELTPDELIHFHNNLKNGGPPIFGIVVKFFQSNCDFLVNIKMVRMVHRKGFYNTELKICDGQNELLRKTEFLRRSKKSKFSVDVQNWTFEGCSKTKILFKIFLRSSAAILARCPIKII